MNSSPSTEAHPPIPSNPSAAPWVFAVLMLVVLWNLPNMGSNLVPRNYFTWTWILMVCALGIGIALSKAEVRYNWRSLPLFLAPLGFVLASLFNETIGFQNAALLGTTMTAVFALYVHSLQQLRLDQEVVDRVIGVICGAAFLSVVLALIGPDYLKWLDNSAFFLRLGVDIGQGGFQQRNNFASFIACVSLLGIWRLSQHDGPMRRPALLLLGACLLVTGVLMALNGSRTGLLGFVAGWLALIAMAWSGPSLARMRVLVGGGAFMLGLGLVQVLSLPVFGGLFELGVAPFSRVADLGAGMSTTTRLSFWQVSLAMFADNPLTGIGLGNWTAFYDQYHLGLVAQGMRLDYLPKTDHPHNEIMLVLAETGLIGTLFILLPYAVVFLALLWRSTRESRMAWACLIPIFLHINTEFPMHASGVHWAVLGLVLVVGMQAKSPFHTLSIGMVRPRLRLVLGISCMALIGVLVLGLAQTGYTSYRMWKDGVWLVQPNGQFFQDAAEHPSARNRLLQERVVDATAMVAAMYITVLSPEGKRIACELIADTRKRWLKHETLEYAWPHCEAQR